MPEPVVELLEVVDVEDADAERHPLLLRVAQVAVEPVVEVPVVPEPGDGVGEGEAHRGELPEDRALVEGDGGERPDERRREEGRALPEDREHEGERRHDRERDERRGDRAAEQREEAVARPAADDRCDEREIDEVEGCGGDGDLDREPSESVVRHRRADRSGRGGREAVDGRVVEHADGRLAPADLDQELGEQPDEDRGRPPVDDRRADDEDRGERGSPDRHVLDRDGEGLDERGGEQQRHQARDGRRRGLVGGHGGQREHADERAGEDDRGDDGEEPRRFAGYPSRPRRLRAGLRNGLRDGQ